MFSNMYGRHACPSKRNLVYIFSEANFPSNILFGFASDGSSQGKTSFWKHIFATTSFNNMI